MIACLALASWSAWGQDAPKPDAPRTPVDGADVIRREARERMMKDRARDAETAAQPWRIGLMVDPIDATLRNHLDIPEKTGVIVAQCAENSPATKAGIMKNDIILMVNGRPVGSIEPLREAVEASGKTGAPLRLSTLRKGQRREVIIKPELPKPTPEREKSIARPAPVMPGMMRDSDIMMRRVAEQHSKLMERLERQEGEMKRLREQVEQMSKAMREMKRDGDKE